MVVGSLCSGMPLRSRLVNTEATISRSSACPVSFSTTDASVSSSAGVFSGESVARFSQAASRRRCWSTSARRSSSTSSLPGR